MKSASRTSVSVRIECPVRGRPPRCDDDLRRAQQGAKLVDDRALDLGGRNPADRAVVLVPFDDRLVDVVAVELLALAGVGRRHGPARSGPKISPFSRAGVWARVLPARLRGDSANAAWTLSHRDLEMIASCSPG